MTETEIKAEMRLWALECATCQLFAIFYKQLLPEGGAELAFAAQMQMANRLTFKHVDPALSDLYAAEFEAATARLVQMQREYMEADDEESEE